MKFALTATPIPVRSAPILLCGPVEKAFEIAARYGYDGVELHLRDRGDVNVAAVRKYMKTKGLSVTTLGTGIAALQYGINFAHPEAEIRTKAVEHVNAIIELAGELGSAVTIGSFSGKAGKGKDREARRKAAIECVGKCAAAAKKAGVTILYEPLNRYENDYLNNVADGLEVLGQLRTENVKLLCDTYHMNIEEVDFVEALKRAGNRLGYVHLVDSNRCGPGMGHLPFGKIMAGLSEMAYKGYLSFECLPLPDGETAARESIGYVKKLLDK
jgi:sugar phosphate isomerase/epimerase